MERLLKLCVCVPVCVCVVCMMYLGVWYVYACVVCMLYLCVWCVCVCMDVVWCEWCVCVCVCIWVCVYVCNTKLIIHEGFSAAEELDCAQAHRQWALKPI